MANNGIIDQIVDQRAIDSLIKLKKELADNSTIMKALSAEAKNLNAELNKASTIKELIPLLKRNKEILDAANAAEKERISILNQTQILEAKEAALKTAEAKKLEELRQKIADANRELRNQIKEQNAAVGSINALRLSLAQATKAYDAMSAELRNGDAGKKAAADIKTLSDELKKLEHDTGRDQRNVGNYFEAIKKALGQNAGMENIIKAMNAQFTEMRTNLLQMQNAYSAMTATMRNSDAGKKEAENMRQLKTEISKITEEIKKLESTTQQGQANVSGFFDSMKKGLMTVVSAFGIITGIRALVNVFKSGYSTIVDFEQANANLASLMQKEIRGIKALTEEAKDLGRTTEYTAGQVTSLQSALATLGFRENQISDMAEPILKFATATSAGLGEAAQLAGNAMRAFGLESEEITRVVSAMAVGTTKSALSFSYLQSAMSTIAPVARTYGFTIEDTVSLLGTLANVGFDASSAATATRNILLNLANSSGKLAVELGRPVKNIDDLSIALKELNARGIDLAGTLALTDKRSVSAFNAFIRGADSLVELRDGVTSVSEQLDKMHKTRLNTVEGATKLLESAWEGLILSFSGSTGLFKTVIDLLTTIVEVIKAITNFISKLSPAIWILIKGWAAYIVTAKIVTMLTFKEAGAIATSIIMLKAKNAALAIAKALTLLYAAAQAILTGNTIRATAAMRLFSRSLMANPIGLAVGILTAVGFAIAAIVKKNNDATRSFKRLNESQKEFISETTSEQTQIDILFGKLKKATEGTDEYNKAKKNILDKYGLYLEGLGEEVLSLKNVEKAYKAISAAAMQAAKDRALEKGISAASDAYAETFATNAKTIRNAFIGKFDNGEELFQELKTAIEKGLDFSPELEKSMQSFWAKDFWGAGYSNVVKDAIKNIRSAKSIMGGEIDEFNSLYSESKPLDPVAAQQKEIAKLELELKELIEGSGEYIKKQEEIRQKRQKLEEMLSKPVKSEPIDINIEIDAARQKIKKLEDEIATLRKNIALPGMTGSFEEEIAEREKQLKDVVSTLDTLTGKKDKIDNKEADAAQKKIDEVDKRIKDVQKKIADLEFQDISEPLKKIADDEEKSLEQRLVALRQYYEEKQLMQSIQDDTEEVGIDAKIFEAKAKKNLELVAKLEAEKLEVVKLHALEREKVEEEMQSKIDDITKKHVTKQISELKDRIQEEQTKLKAQQLDEEKRLFDEYRKGLIKREEYERKKHAIQVKYSKLSAQAGIDSLQEMLDSSTDLSVKQRKELQDELTKMQQATSQAEFDQAQKDFEKKLAFEERLAQEKKRLQEEAWNFAETLLSAQFEKQIQRYDAEITKINEHKDAEIAALEKSGKTKEEIEEAKMIIEARADAQTKAIEQRKRETQIRQAKFEKAFAIAKATIDGAQAITKTLATVGLPAAIPLLAVLAGITALQIATILAQPIPQYAKGTADHPGGPAVLGDAHKKEAVIEPSGRVWVSKAKPTLIPNLPKHSIVLPSADEFLKPNMQVFDNLHGVESMRAKAIELSFDAAVERQTRKLSNTIRESKSSLSVNLDSHGIYKISEGGQRYIRFTGSNLRH